MVVVVLTACPAGLRGHLTRWLLEIASGVFVGRVPKRVRDHLWTRIVELCLDGRAIMVETASGEQGFTFRVHRHDWEPDDYDGIALIRRPSAPSARYTGMRPGWSLASKYRRAARSRK